MSGSSIEGLCKTALAASTTCATKRTGEESFCFSSGLSLCVGSVDTWLFGVIVGIVVVVVVLVVYIFGVLVVYVFGFGDDAFAETSLEYKGTECGVLWL